MCSKFRAIVFAVVNDARPICTGAQLSWGFVSLVKQFLHFSIIAIKPLLMFSGGYRPL